MDPKRFKDIKGNIVVSLRILPPSARLRLEESSLFLYLDTLDCHHFGDSSSQ